MRIVLADGTVLDTRDEASRAVFAQARPELALGLTELGRSTREDTALAQRIRHKYRLKNTTGYGLNALVDHSDPVDILSHLIGAATAVVRIGLGVADKAHGIVGTGLMKGTMDGLRKASGGRIPKWSPALPQPLRFAPRPQAPQQGERVVYFPSCAARNMGSQRGHKGVEALPTVAERLFRRAGFDVVYPAGMAGLCCGQPFESKGLVEAADQKAAELEAALAQVSRKADGSGHWPIVFDTSPCAWRMKKFLGERLPVHDSIEFVHDVLLPRLTLQPQPGAVAVHPVCSVRKMGTVDKLVAIAARCSTQVVQAQAVQCCGFAGDRGFNRPELNEHALRHLKAELPEGCSGGYSTSRTCEIGLSETAEMPYQSILYLVERCSAATPPAGASPPIP